jgi:hypothetical protein
MAQASEAVNKAPKTTTVTLADGREIAVRKLSWLSFKEMWGEVSQLVFLITQMSEAENLDAAQVAEKMLCVPELAEKFIAGTTDLSIADVQKLDDYLEVLLLMTEAIVHNRPTEVWSFFGRVMKAVSGSTGEAESS